MKKCSSRLAALAVSALSFSNMIAFAENSENSGSPKNPEVISGTWGDLDYTIRDHVLTVSGEGEIFTDVWFADCNLPEWNVYAEDIYEIVLEEGITGTGDYAFSHYPNLEKITIPSSFTVLAPYVFYDDPKLTEINGLEHIQEFNFRCLSETAYIQEHEFVILDDVLYYAEGTNFTVPDGVMEIRPFAFGNCIGSDFIDIEFFYPDTKDVTSQEQFIEESYCDLNLQKYEIILPDSVQKIDAFAFAYCATMTNIQIPDSVKEIGEYAFYNCVNLENLTLPESVESLGEWALFNCKSLENLTVLNPEMRFADQAFGTVIDRTVFLETSKLHESELEWKIYQKLYQQQPFLFDYMATVLSVEFLSAEEYTSVMQTIKELDFESDFLQQKGILTGYTDSTAQAFAEENNLEFRALNQESYEMGDANLDGSVDIRDVVFMNRVYVGVESCTAEQIHYADMDGSGKIELTDSMAVLRKLVGLD
ncbi:MAG: leucine-rich repeat protein [Oscillospiraceae bacterium]|nr:leucine-rich repeat protein [Oscillospiraceae bacterium]